MPTFSNIAITFLDAFEPNTATPRLAIRYSNAATNTILLINETVVPTRTRSGEFSTGTDSTTQAQLYKDALDLDLVPSGDWEVTILGDTVTIGSTIDTITFDRFLVGEPNTSRVSILIDNFTNTIPRTEGIIPARSNYYITRPITDPNVVSQTVKMWFDSDEINPDYQQRTPDYQSTQLRPSANWENFDLAITQYARDFITPKLPTFAPGLIDSVTGSVITSSISVRNNLEGVDQPILNQVVTTLGYATYQQGAKPIYNKSILLSSRRHQVKRGELIIVPVNNNTSSTTLTLRDSNGFSIGLSLNTSLQTEINKAIQYACFSTQGLTDDFVTVNNDYIFELIDECLYETQSVRFLNRFGVWENLTFFKAEKESVQISREGNFKNNYVNGGTYDTSRHLYRNTDTNARRSLQLTTGYISEEQNEAIQDLLLSDYVYLENGEPMEVDTNSVDKKTRIVDKLINYEMSFKYSSDLVQVV